MASLIPSVSDMSSASPSGSTLVCFDGSEGSRDALHSVAHLLAAKEVVVLTVWQSLASRLAATGGFGAFALDDEEELDRQEQAAAREAAEDAARRAREHGFSATARIEESTSTAWQTIVDVANEIDAALILCGTRGRGRMESFLLGSTSHGVLRNAHRPVLIAPEPKHGD
jgi:nucleotide-binding universal stress UspA family protein